MTKLLSFVSVNQLIEAVSWAIFSLMFYTYGGMLPFLIALRTINIKKTRLAVKLSCIDATAMFWSGFFIWGAAPLLFLWGIKYALIGCAILLFIWFGFRLSISVSSKRTRVVRKVAFFIPWSWTTFHGQPHAFTDGWGDFEDPEAINVELGDGKRMIELAWGDKYSGSRCDDLAAEFNNAIATMNC